MTRALKVTSLGSLANSYLGDSPQPSTLSYIWNFGSLLALCLVGQIVTGVILAMHYCPEAQLAFTSVEHIMRDVAQGWMVRYLHANIASLFFAFVYAHVARGLYYGSYKSPRIAPWSIGVILLVFMILTAFLGYCLVIGQMSLWGATVITSILGALPWLGGDLTELVWGGFSVSNATLNRFYALHFLFPFILAALAIIHIITLHKHGSGNPLGVDASIDRLPMAPYFLFKDAVTAVFFVLTVMALVSFAPNWLGHSDNYVEANALVTPSSIVPEWYLLPWYAVLRSVPNKLLGVLAMLAGLLVLLVLPVTDTARNRGARFNPALRLAFWNLLVIVLLLLYVGACHVADPWVIMGQILTLCYFGYFVLLVPAVGLGSVVLLESLANSTLTPNPQVLPVLPLGCGDSGSPDHVYVIRDKTEPRYNSLVWLHRVDRNEWNRQLAAVGRHSFEPPFSSFLHGAHHADLRLLTAQLELERVLSGLVVRVGSEGRPLTLEEAKASVHAAQRESDDARVALGKKYALFLEWASSPGTIDDFSPWAPCYEPPVGTGSFERIVREPLSLTSSDEAWLRSTMSDAFMVEWDAKVSELPHKLLTLPTHKRRVVKLPPAIMLGRTTSTLNHELRSLLALSRRV